MMFIYAKYLLYAIIKKLFFSLFLIYFFALDHMEKSGGF